MGAGYHGGFGNTDGKKKHQNKVEQAKPLVIKSNRKPIFSEKGHVTVESISNRREFFLGKSVAKIEHILHDNGYETKRRSSKHATSRAKIIVTTNHSADRNITQVQVSPGSFQIGRAHV